MEINRDFEHETQSSSSAPARSLAIVSGKGGSGKTMVAAEIARILDYCGIPVVIFDADTGTAGMTYYLGIKCADNTSVGLANLLTNAPIEEKPPYHPDSSDDVDYVGLLQNLSNFKGAKLFGMGDQRLLLLSPKKGRTNIESRFERLVPSIIQSFKQIGFWVIIDCRGGIDSESLSVCQAVDDILLIAETDATSFQATQYLVQALSRNRAVLKLRGFIINKAINDPTQIALIMASSYKCKHLASIPFDLRSIKAFLVGDIPDVNSVFGVQIWWGLYNLYFPGECICHAARLSSLSAVA
jgi:septum site-determining protein MinD